MSLYKSRLIYRQRCIAVYSAAQFSYELIGKYPPLFSQHVFTMTGSSSKVKYRRVHPPGPPRQSEGRVAPSITLHKGLPLIDGVINGNDGRSVADNGEQIEGSSRPQPPDIPFQNCPICARRDLTLRTKQQPTLSPGEAPRGAPRTRCFCSLSPPGLQRRGALRIRSNIPWFPSPKITFDYHLGPDHHALQPHVGVVKRARRKLIGTFKNGTESRT